MWNISHSERRKHREICAKLKESEWKMCGKIYFIAYWFAIEFKYANELLNAIHDAEMAHFSMCYSHENGNCHFEKYTTSKVILLPITHKFQQMCKVSHTKFAIRGETQMVFSVTFHYEQFGLYWLGENVRTNTLLRSKLCKFRISISELQFSLKHGFKRPFLNGNCSLVWVAVIEHRTVHCPWVLLDLKLYPFSNFSRSFNCLLIKTHPRDTISAFDENQVTVFVVSMNFSLLKVAMSMLNMNRSR